MTKLLEEISAQGEGFVAALLNARDVAPQGRYRHWDKLRRLTPPAGLTTQGWWIAIKMARSVLMKNLPLRDSDQRPFQFAVPDCAQELLHQIDREAQGNLTLQGLEQHAFAEDKSYLVNSLIEEAITSSQLEGASTTHRVAKEMIREKRSPKDQSERMIYNNYMAMNHIRQIKDLPLSAETVFDLHRMLTENTLEIADGGGRFRRPDEDIFVGDTMEGDVLHTPPPATQLAERLKLMCEFANAEKPFVHPVVRSILLHFWLAYDHPFVDGNGRTARTLFYWSMLKHGYWLSEYLSISTILKKAPSKYGRAFLYSESDDNDATYFLMNQLAVIKQAIRDLNNHLSRTLQERKATEALLRKSSGINHRQLALLTHALKHTGTEYTIEGHSTSHAIVYQTARADLLDLEKRKLLDKRKIGKAFVFTAPRNLAARLKQL